MRLQALNYPPHEKYTGKNESGFMLLTEEVLWHLVSDFAETDITYPMIFCVENTQTGAKTYGCAHEFSMLGSQCCLPTWMFSQLNLQARDLVDIKLEISRIPIGTRVLLEPVDESFWFIRDYKESLEQAFQSYVALSQGDTISIEIDSHAYNVTVAVTEPAPVILILNCDLEIDFRRPQSVQNIIDSAPQDVQDDDNFPVRIPTPEVGTTTTTTISQPDAPTVARKRHTQSDTFVPFSGKGYTLGRN